MLKYYLLEKILIKSQKPFIKNNKFIYPPPAENFKFFCLHLRKPEALNQRLLTRSSNDKEETYSKFFRQKQRLENFQLSPPALIKKNKQANMLGLSQMIKILQAKQAPNKAIKNNLPTLKKSNTYLQNSYHGQKSFEAIGAADSKKEPFSNSSRRLELQKHELINNYLKVDKYRLVQTMLLSCFKVSQETNGFLQMDLDLSYLPSADNKEIDKKSLEDFPPNCKEASHRKLFCMYGQNSYLPLVNPFLSWATPLSKKLPPADKRRLQPKFFKTKQNPKTFLSYWLVPVMGFFMVASGKATSNSFSNSFLQKADKVSQASLGAWQKKDTIDFGNIYSNPPEKANAHFYSTYGLKSNLQLEQKNYLPISHNNEMDKLALFYLEKEGQDSLGLKETFPLSDKLNNKKRGFLISGAYDDLNPNYLPNRKSSNFIPFIKVPKSNNFLVKARGLNNSSFSNLIPEGVVGDGLKKKKESSFPEFKKQPSFSRKPLTLLKEQTHSLAPGAKTSFVTNPGLATPLLSSGSMKALSKKNTSAFFLKGACVQRPYLKLKTTRGCPDYKIDLIKCEDPLGSWPTSLSVKGGSFYTPEDKAFGLNLDSGLKLSAGNFFETPILNYKQASFFLNFLIKGYTPEVGNTYNDFLKPTALISDKATNNSQKLRPQAFKKESKKTLNSLGLKFVENGNFYLFPPEALASDLNNKNLLKLKKLTDLIINFDIPSIKESLVKGLSNPKSQTIDGVDKNNAVGVKKHLNKAKKLNNFQKKYMRAYSSVYESTFNYLSLISNPPEAKTSYLNSNRQENSSSQAANRVMEPFKASGLSISQNLFLGPVTTRLPIVTGGFFRTIYLPIKKSNLIIENKQSKKALTPTKLSGSKYSPSQSMQSPFKGLVEIKSLASNRSFWNKKNSGPVAHRKETNAAGLNKDNFFYNYLKYIRLKLSILLTSVEPINGTLVYKKNTYGVKSHLPDQPFKVGQAPLEAWPSKAPNKALLTYNSYNTLKKETLDANNSKSAQDIVLHNTFYKTFFSQNSLPTVLLHKKFLIKLKPNLKKASLLTTAKKGQAPLEAWSTLRSEASKEEIAYIESQKNLHKKSKAKRQRLESRQQKKRKRFFPRPNWLRLRLVLNFYKNKKPPEALTNIAKLNIGQAPLGTWSAKKPSAEPIKTTITKKSLLALNNYIQSLSNRKLINVLDKKGFLLEADKAKPTSKYLSPEALIGKQALNIKKGLASAYKLILDRNKSNFTDSLIDPYYSDNAGGSNITNFSTVANYTNFNKIKYNLWLLSYKAIKAKNAASSRTLNGDVSGYPPGAKVSDLNKPSLKVGQAFKEAWPKAIQKNYNKIITKKGLAGGRYDKVITSIKNNSSYALFENKANNNQPKKETNNNLLRDFWIWLYNNTSNNSFKKHIVIDNFLNHFSIPINIVADNQKSQINKKSGIIRRQVSMDSALSTSNIDGVEKSPNYLPVGSGFFNSYKKVLYKSNSNSLKRSYWAFHKTNLVGSHPLTNKRTNIWSIQKLRNQSKNNKTKFLEKKIRKEIDLVLFPTLKKQAPSNKTLKLSNKVIKSYKINISQKIHKKEKKLAYLAKVNSNINMPEASWAWPIPIQETFVSWPKLTTNFNWWSSFTNLEQSHLWLEPMPFLKDKTLPALNLQKSYFSSVSAKQKAALAAEKKVDQEQKSQAPSEAWPKLFKMSAEPMAFVLGLHFCAFISLLSISQVRCFIKFHLILLHKLSNIYLHIIYTNLRLTTQSQAFFKGNAGGIIKKSKQSFLNRKSFKDNRILISGIHNKKEFTKSAHSKKTKKPNSIYNILKSYSKIQNIQNKRPFIENLKQLFTLGLTPTALFNYRNRKYQAPYVPLAKASGLYPSPAIGVTDSLLLRPELTFLSLAPKNIAADGFFQNKPSYKTVCLNYKKTYSYRKILDSHLFIQNYLNGQAPKSGWPTPTGDTSRWSRTVNFIANFLLFLKAKALSGLEQKRAINLKQEELSSPSITRSELIKKSLYIKIISKLSAEPIAFFTTNYATEIKAGSLYIVFKLIDTFEYFLRLIYGFFEKPTELTMDWVAYAFLVEWSSDLITFTPENQEKKKWLVFTRITRQSKILFLPFFSNFTGFGLLKSNLKESIIMKVFSGPFLFFSNFFQLSAQLIFGQLLYKRLLMLNDLFLDILNRPDTDLINRQQKGTLFWDIWSDVLIKAADNYNINIPSLSNIKEEQNVLIDRFLSNPPEAYPPNSSGRLEFKKVPFFTVKWNRDKAKAGSLNKDKAFINKSLYKKPNPFKDLAFYESNFTRVSRLAPLIGQHYKSSLPELNLNAVGANTKKGISFYHYKAYGLKPPTDNLIKTSGAYTSRISNNAGFEYVTYQSKETELFLDYHPPKSFNHVSAIQYYSIVQQPIGNLVCQIYSGILTKQISKNVLVIGSTLSSNTDTINSMQKTLLIQALAGETEIKIITDNASRYAVVNRGFAVGIKLLKEVFEAIALNTPCLFLLEDIHLIGERRPLLISDHGDALGDSGENKAVETTFGSQSNGEAVHEKNQVYYQLSRHGITHYKKPFKGDFSLSIPTNHFSFDLFCSVNFSKRYSNYASTLTNPLSYGFKASEEQKGFSGMGDAQADSQGPESLFNAVGAKKLNSKRKVSSVTGSSQKNMLSSYLQIGRNHLLSPPSTSPFSVFLLKEQKQFKPKKIVNELPWIGLPSEQLSILPRVSYSVRAKVAALADLGFSSISAKLDMITDLLVIIDSVRGNRGFVVFATTHLPHILDPALRRPGRLDETISLPTLTNLWNRWEFTKATKPFIFTTGSAWADGKTLNVSTKAKAFDFKTSYLIASLDSWPTNYTTNTIIGYHGTLDYLDYLNYDLIPNQKMNFISPIISNLAKANTFTENGLLTRNSKKSTRQRSQDFKSYSPPALTRSKTQEHFKSTNIAYFQMGKKIIKACPGIYIKTVNSNSSRKLDLIVGQSPLGTWQFNPVYNNASGVSTFESTISITESSSFLFNELQYKSLYASTNMIQKTLLDLLSGKLSELFAFKTLPLMFFSSSAGKIKKQSNSLNTSRRLELKATSNLKYVPTANSRPSPVVGFAKTKKADLFGRKQKKCQAPLGTFIKQNFISLYGIDQTWRAATSLALSFVKKRYLYNKNLIVPKLLNFLDYSVIDEPPGPPSGKSNILIPAKRFENYKKVYKENIEKKAYSSFIQEKLESHSKQSYIKSIYKKSNNQRLLPNLTLAYKEIGSIVSQAPSGAWQVNNSPLAQPTSFNWYYRNKILKRHRNYLTNQWWNGQLTEHSAESLFLSDIDWRLTFNTFDQVQSAMPLEEQAMSSSPMVDYTPSRLVPFIKFLDKLKENPKIRPEALTKGILEILNKSKINQISTGDGSISKVDFLENSFNKQDILVDFPDSDQLYNPKHRRWMLASGYNSSWFTFDKKIQTEFVEHLIFECFIQSFNILDQNRELLDYSVTKYLKTGLIKEIHFLFLLTAAGLLKGKDY